MLEVLPDTMKSDQGAMIDLLTFIAKNKAELQQRVFDTALGAIDKSMMRNDQTAMEMVTTSIPTLILLSHNDQKKTDRLLDVTTRILPTVSSDGWNANNIIKGFLEGYPDQKMLRQRIFDIAMVTLPIMEDRAAAGGIITSLLTAFGNDAQNRSVILKAAYLF